MVDGSRQWLFLSTLFDISKRAWHEHINNLISFHTQESFLKLHLPSALHLIQLKNLMFKK